MTILARLKRESPFESGREAAAITSENKRRAMVAAMHNGFSNTIHNYRIKIMQGPNNEKPTGIIRTLPGNEEGKANYLASLEGLKDGSVEAFYIALASKPKVEVLHLYLLIDGKISVRLNIADYEPGDSRRCWDGETRAPKFWAICTGPVSEPPEPIKRRGFQGFRYTGDLW